MVNCVNLANNVSARLSNHIGHGLHKQSILNSGGVRGRYSRTHNEYIVASVDVVKSTSSPTDQDLNCRARAESRLPSNEHGVQVKYKGVMSSPE